MVNECGDVDFAMQNQINLKHNFSLLDTVFTKKEQARLDPTAQNFAIIVQIPVVYKEEMVFKFWWALNKIRRLWGLKK